MGRFNLLDERWISVIADEMGRTEEVSLKELFANAHAYKGLAGDTKTQDFAVFRVLLAVLHTVFSRFDADGNEYGFIPLDERWKPVGELEDEDEKEEYLDALYCTWVNLWNYGKLPSVVDEYLEKWRDRFYLFDEEHPFFQVTSEDIAPSKINKTQASEVSGKNINRLISESGNKIALFSPKYEAKDNKSILSPAEIARWLIMFQGYTGLSDKVIYGKEKYKASKGWLFDIGGITLKGKTLRDSLLLNCALLHPKTEYQVTVQRPCWEYSSDEVIQTLFKNKIIDNLAELYTNWSRAIRIDPNIDVDRTFSFEIVKLPSIYREKWFLELMTLWRYNKTGDYKDAFTPRKHRVNQSLWRSFGLITISNDMSSKETEEHQAPGIMDWLNDISDVTSDFPLTLEAISMQADGKPASWVPVDEIYDSLNIHDAILTDVKEAGWVPRINDVIEETKKIIGWTYRNFVSDIKQIRNLSTSGFIDRRVEEFYFLVDQPFRDWLASIRPTDEKDEKIFEWRRELKKLAYKQAQGDLEDAGPRDYTGITEKGKTEKEKAVKNIATAYNWYTYSLNKILPEERRKKK